MNEFLLRRLLPAELLHARLPVEDHRQAAVLVPLEPGRGVWLTRRAVQLPNHAGQVAFPGGKIEVFDASVEAAALREAEEEVGLRPGEVEILGRMDEVITRTGFHMAPVLGLVPRDVVLRPRAEEVQDVFCLPFEVLLDPAAPRLRRAEWRGVVREFWVWPHETYVIWGATAEILLNLARLLRAVG